MNVTTTPMKSEHYGDILAVDVDGYPAGFFHFIGKHSPRDLAFAWMAEGQAHKTVFPMVDTFPNDAEVRRVLDKYRPDLMKLVGAA